MVVDAFTALADVHEYGLVHRALHPRRIWLGRRMRVMFSDFHLARIPGEVTIRLWAPDHDISEDYRAPECAADVGLATAQSDVYSLALSASPHWLLGKGPEDLTLDEFRNQLCRHLPVGLPHARCAGRFGLGPTAQRRRSSSNSPHLRQCLGALRQRNPSSQSSVIDGRYEIIRQLG